MGITVGVQCLLPFSTSGAFTFLSTILTYCAYYYIQLRRVTVRAVTAIIAFPVYSIAHLSVI